MNRLLLSCSIFAAAGCVVENSPPPAVPEPPVVQATADESETPAPAEPAGTASTAQQRTLGDFLSGAERVEIRRIQAGGAMSVTEVFDATKTAHFLGTLNLAQTPNGPVVRCPSTTVYKVLGPNGQSLGEIGLCESGTELAATFDAPDGTFGGIDPPRQAAR